MAAAAHLHDGLVHLAVIEHLRQRIALRQQALRPQVQLSVDLNGLRPSAARAPTRPTALAGAARDNRMRRRPTLSARLAGMVKVSVAHRCRVLMEGKIALKAHQMLAPVHHKRRACDGTVFQRKAHRMRHIGCR